MAWSMPHRQRSNRATIRWDRPPPVAEDRRARIDAPTAADLVQRRASEPPGTTGAE